MELSKIEKIFLDFLRTSKATKRDQVMAALAVRTDAQMEEMCRFMAENPEASGGEILGAAQRAVRMYPEKTSEDL